MMYDYFTLYFNWYFVVKSRLESKPVTTKKCI